MAAPQPAMMLPRELKHESIVLNTKPTASIQCTFAQGSASQKGRSVLVVFLNGLMADKSTWLPVMAGIIRGNQDGGYPSLLAYDRFGQGLTDDRDPQDQGREPGYGHDVLDVAQDLHQIITQISEDKMKTTPERVPLIFVANSIGCVIARLYADSYPGSVAALLLLDSMMANSNFDWWPDPDSSDFNAEELPADVDIEILREQRAKFAAIFAPDVVNKEGLDRRNVAELLPHSDRPRLCGPGNRRPLITVVEHDPDRFASESLKVFPNIRLRFAKKLMSQSMGTPVSLTRKYSNQMWHRYNQGLLKITDPDLVTGPIVAKNCGHFVQRDDPSLVVKELMLLLAKLRL
ncbi:MAG: hypothetical protein Q9197_004324 [Variospora fuerteventurae]